MNNEELGRHLGKIVQNYNETALANELSHQAQSAEAERIESHQEQLGANVRGANDKQVGGEHYTKNSIQPWDYIVVNNLGYLEGNIVKYISRWKDKGGVEDLKKAQHYLSKLIEVAEGG